MNSTIKYCTISPTILEETFQLQGGFAAPGPRWGQAPRPPRVPPFQIPVYATVSRQQAYGSSYVKVIRSRSNLKIWTIICDNFETVYEIPCKLVLITNRKSHIGFRLVPKSVTLNDLERRNELIALILRYFT